VAGSTKDAVQEVANALKTEKLIEAKINADDSSKLATQIAQDAPAHLFLSANEKWAEYVKEKGYAQETTLILGNSLVIVTPKGNPAGITKADDLTKISVKRVAVAGPTVPAGIYAREAFKKLKLWHTLVRLPHDHVHASSRVGRECQGRSGSARMVQVPRSVGP
jgi:molybdate transport system substrate-binding protein